MSELECQIEVVYISKLNPQPESLHPQDETSASRASTMRSNEAARKNTPPNGAAYVNPPSKNPCLRCCQAFRTVIENALDTFFFNYGKLVASYPVTAILLCILLTLLCAAGLLNFRMETDRNKLWIPSNSEQR